MALDRPPAAARRGVLIAAGLLYVTGTVGSNIAPGLVDEHPLPVLALSSRNRNLFASVPYMDPVSYAIVGFARVTLVAVVLYFVGRWFGTRALAWMEGQLGELPSLYRWVQAGVDRAGWLLVLLMPGSNVVCLMVGHRRMPLVRFLPLLAAGTTLKLVVLWYGGKRFEDQIRSFLDFIQDYQWWLVGGLFAISFLQAGLKARSSASRLIADLEDPPPLPANEVEGASLPLPADVDHPSDSPAT